ncbi:hypothetical protein [Aliarcobacter butzleri]|uniref:hypothetical protein n=1 Tax=Aliarcobacter butzleri TaxID=28197 RepID=UPI002B242051|nr:hypothetical protein [Aliarcobacter butzleri]
MINIHEFKKSFEKKVARAKNVDTLIVVSLEEYSRWDISYGKFVVKSILNLFEIFEEKKIFIQENVVQNASMRLWDAAPLMMFSADDLSKMDKFISHIDIKNKKLITLFKKRILKLTNTIYFLYGKINFKKETFDSLIKKEKRLKKIISDENDISYNRASFEEIYDLIMNKGYSFRYPDYHLSTTNIDRLFTISTNFDNKLCIYKGLNIFVPELSKDDFYEIFVGDLELIA